MLRLGLLVSSPSTAAPSNPAKLKMLNTMPKPTPAQPLKAATGVKVATVSAAVGCTSSKIRTHKPMMTATTNASNANISRPARRMSRRANQNASKMETAPMYTHVLPTANPKPFSASARKLPTNAAIPVVKVT